MTRVSRRGIVRALRAPVPDPPPELGRQLKEQIPEDLFATRATPPARTRRALGRKPWALAASLLVAIGSGYLAVRLFEDRRGAARQQVADFDRSRVTEPVAERDEGGPRDDSSGGAMASRPAEPSPQDAPSRPPAAARPNGAGAVLHDQTLPPIQQERRAETRSAASEQTQAESIEEQNRRIQEQDQKIRELEAEKRKLEREMHALPGTAAGRETAEQDPIPPPEAPRVKWSAERQRELLARVDRLRSDRPTAAGADRSSLGPDSDDAGASVEVAAQPISTLAVTVGQRSLADAVGSAANADPAIPMSEILDAAAGTRAAAAGTSIEVAGTPARRPGRVALLLSAIVAESDGRHAETGPASSIELELDPAAARSYRLLASHAHALAASAPSGPAADERPAGVPSAGAPARGPSSATGRETPTPLYRLTALFEIELAPGRSASATLGAVRLRGGGAAGSSPSTPRPIGGADLAGGWDQARAELRLAVLAAELSVLQRDAGAAQLAPFAQEIERLRAGARLEPAAARLAAELETLVRRPGEPAPDDDTRPAAAPARDDG